MSVFRNVKDIRSKIPEKFYRTVMNHRTAKKSKPSKKRPGNIYDAFVKNIFGRLLVFIDFLQNYADPHFVSNIEINKIYPAPTHYFGLKGDEQILDLVFCCPLKKSNANMKAVILFEHAGSSLKTLPVRLLGLAGTIWWIELKKKQKVLSAIYFIVLRTGKKPRRRRYTQLADWLPKDENGQPIGAVPEIKYDVIDLPAINNDKLCGGTELRLGLGILKKMTEGMEDEFADAMLPLMEIDDAEQQAILTNELLEFTAKVFAARKKRLDAEMIDKALKPIFKERTKPMIMTIF
ncbi:MAG: Rpn family recombination-promoting nuclease/putative transposase, partial [Planctomycetaceae bacterium]|nr:Rpn family recombination-promoting nuclease/putative transposase [Planctomycetaceae bacterium]